MKRRTKVEGKSDTSKTELETMKRSKIYYARMRATANKTGRTNEICLSRKKIRKLQKPVRRNEKYKKRMYGNIMERRQQQNRKVRDCEFS